MEYGSVAEIEASISKCGNDVARKGLLRLRKRAFKKLEAVVLEHLEKLRNVPEKSATEFVRNIDAIWACRDKVCWYKQAEQDFFEAHKQITALEEQAMKYLTGENSLDIAIVNAMMPKYREKFHNAQSRMDEVKQKTDEEKETSRAAAQEVNDLISWADAFDEANIETKHMIIARLIERIDVGRDYDIQIKFRISVEQYTGTAA